MTVNGVTHQPIFSDKYRVLRIKVARKNPAKPSNMRVILRRNKPAGMRKIAGPSTDLKAECGLSNRSARLKIVATSMSTPNTE
jgi:hypothetical protein